MFPFVHVPDDDSSFSSVLKLLTRSVKISCMPGKTNIFATDEMLDNLTPHEVTENQVTNIANIHETTSADSTTQEPRRTSKTINTPSYLKDYTYNLPKLHSLNTFVSHNNHV